MTSLFGSAGTVVSTLVVSPAANGTPGAALVYFAEPNAAASAADLFDSFPFAGSLLEVRKAEAAAAARVLAALAEAQVSVAGAAPPVPAPQVRAMPGQGRAGLPVDWLAGLLWPLRQRTFAAKLILRSYSQTVNSTEGWCSRHY